jgi:hypothetical protein
MDPRDDLRDAEEPPQAKGIDAGDLRFVWGQDKIIFATKNRAEHFTVHFGPDSKVLDVHRTLEGPRGSTSHETLFSITHEKLVAIFSEIAHPLFRVLSGIAVPFPPSLLRRPDVTAIVGIPLSLEQFVSVSRMHKRRLAADPAKVRSRLWVAQSFDELQTIGDGEFFTVLSRRRNKQPRHIGNGFAVSMEGGGRRQVAWIPSHRFALAMSGAERLLRQAAARHGIGD